MYITCLFSATTKCIMDESPKSSGPPPIDFVTGRLGDDTPKHQAHAFCATTTAQTSKLPTQKYMYRTSKWFNRITGYKSLKLHPSAGPTNPLECQYPTDLSTSHIPRSQPPGKPPPCLSRFSNRQTPHWLPLLLPDLPPGSTSTTKWYTHAYTHPFSRLSHKKFKSCTSLDSGLSAVAAAQECQAITAPVALTHEHCYLYYSTTLLSSATLYFLCYSLRYSLCYSLCYFLCYSPFYSFSPNCCCYLSAVLCYSFCCCLPCCSPCSPCCSFSSAASRSASSPSLWNSPRHAHCHRSLCPPHPLFHPLCRSLCRSPGRSPGYSLYSLCRSLCRSPGRSLCRSLCRSPGRSLCRSPGRSC